MLAKHYDLVEAAIVDKKLSIGGVCVHTGTIPSKTTRAGRENLQRLGQSPRRGDQLRATEDRILEGRHQDMKMKRAMAELTEMASGMITQIGGSGETLDRLSNIMQEERQKAAGRARVARDSMDMSGVQVKEGEQHALAEQALADFARSRSLRPCATRTLAMQPSAASRV
jgi:pyruvate/2-oxoglutarate dehydrogenase complex dihydrolipoamide dehydrogenase (E3) component